MIGHQTAEARSLAYHRAIATRLMTEPQLVGNARARVVGWSRDASVHPRWIEGWRRLLDLPAQELAAALVKDDQASTDLRQATPFAGALTPRERWAIIRALREAR